MKRIILTSMFIVLCNFLNSCTVDDLENNNKDKKLNVIAEIDSGGDQNGQTTIPPHKPK